MTEIRILDKAPAIMTKDKSFAQKIHKLEPGTIMIVPEDAVLIVAK